MTQEIDALLQAGLGRFSLTKNLSGKRLKSQAAAYSPTPLPPLRTQVIKRGGLDTNTSILQEEVTVQPAVFQPFDDEDIPAEQTSLEIIPSEHGSSGGTGKNYRYSG